MKITTFSEPKELIKEGLLFYSSNPNEPLVDSKGNAHTVTAEDIQALANNTNEYLKYTDIYVFPDHDRDPAKAYGLISDSGCFEAKEITNDIATKHPKLKPLVGRWGLFCNNVKLIEESIVDKVSKGLSKSVSVGADLINKVIKELSITSTPACAGASLFNSNKSNITNFNMETQETTAVTLEEALQDDGEKERIEAEAMQLLDTFLDVVDNIASMSDEDLGNYQVGSKEELYQAQLETFMMMLDEKINPFAGMMDQQQQQVDPRMQPQMQPQAQYNYPLAITTFDEMDQYISEYGLGTALRAGLKVAGKTTGIGNKAKVMGSAIGKGLLGKTKATALGSAIKTGVTGAKTAISNTASSGLNKIGSKVQKTSASLADKLANRRLGRYSSSSKLSKFMK